MQYAYQPGGGWVPVDSAVFKTVGGSLSEPRWVRLPSTPASSGESIVNNRPLTPHSEQEQLLGAVRAVMTVNTVTAGPPIICSFRRYRSICMVS